MNYYHDTNNLEWSDVDYTESEDAESIASLASSNAEERSIERVLAETNHDCRSKDPDSHRFYLIKWTNSSVLRSSWEHVSFLKDRPDIVEEWEAEKKRQAEGKSPAFDYEEFNRRVDEQECRERARRRLRRFKRHMQHILSIVEAD
jgi:hypothetical protein